MTAVIVAYQRALLDGLPPEWERLFYSAVVSVAVFALGFWYFRRSKDAFEETL
jgi:ABC-type polysaccharide/polyol phosphate export permease